MAAGLLASVGLYAAVRASGAPSVPMIYSGVATQGGTPLMSQTISMKLTLLDQSGAQLCTNPQAALVPTDAAGHFTAAFDSTCNDVLLSAQPVVLQVDMSYMGQSLTARRQLGVVPYAIEALHAEVAEEAPLADRATPGGALDLRLAGLGPSTLASDGGAPRYDVIAGYCGATGDVNGAMVATGSGAPGNAQGYAGTSAVCVNAGVCGTEGSPHMCTAEEMVRSAAMGRLPAGLVGWYAGGVKRDCKGYTSSNVSDLGLAWFQDEPSEEACDQEYPVLCCK